MKGKFLVPILAGVIFISSVAACNKKDDDASPSDNLDRKPMLENYANNYIVPGYEQMEQALSLLKADITAFTTNPTETNLSKARQAFKDAYMEWQNVDCINFGPASESSLRDFINVYPVTISKVEGNITSGSYNLEAFGSKDAQGFPAVDYLLNGIGSTDAAIVSMYTTDGNATARKKYLEDVVNKMLEKISAIRGDWDSYKSVFVSSTGTDASSSLSEMVNGYVMYYERYLRSAKVGLPVGAMTGVARADLSEVYYMPELGKELAIEASIAAQRFFEGYTFGTQVDGEGMYDYLAAIGTTDDDGKLMADVVVDEMEQVSNKLQNIPTNIQDGVTNNRTYILETYEELQDVIPLLKVDMVSAFSISITYTDNDGD